MGRSAGRRCPENRLVRIIEKADTITLGRLLENVATIRRSPSESFRCPISPPEGEPGIPVSLPLETRSEGSEEVRAVLSEPDRREGEFTALPSEPEAVTNERFTPFVIEARGARSLPTFLRVQESGSGWRGGKPPIRPEGPIQTVACGRINHPHPVPPPSRGRERLCSPEEATGPPRTATQYRQSNKGPNPCLISTI
jgi:hypothetical protein